MAERLEFTPQEKEETLTLYQKIREQIAPSLMEGDEEKMRQLIMTAMGGTAGVFGVMAMLAGTIKRDLSGLGKWLFAGMLVVFFGCIINVFVGSSTAFLALSTLCIAIFSLYMLYDIKRIIDGGETNYISATLALYLDIYNVFQSLLALLGIFGGED